MRRRQLAWRLPRQRPGRARFVPPNGRPPNGPPPGASRARGASKAERAPSRVCARVVAAAVVRDDAAKRGKMSESIVMIDTGSDTIKAGYVSTIPDRGPQVVRAHPSLPPAYTHPARRSPRGAPAPCPSGGADGGHLEQRCRRRTGAAAGSSRRGAGLDAARRSVPLHPVRAGAESARSSPRGGGRPAGTPGSTPHPSRPQPASPDARRASAAAAADAAALERGGGGERHHGGAAAEHQGAYAPLAVPPTRPPPRTACARPPSVPRGPAAPLRRPRRPDRCLRRRRRCRGRSSRARNSRSCCLRGTTWAACTWLRRPCSRCTASAA